jgi:hypothetical protein
MPCHKRGSYTKAYTKEDFEKKLKITPNKEDLIRDVIGYLSNRESDLEYREDRVCELSNDEVEEVKNLKKWQKELSKLI